MGAVTWDFQHCGICDQQSLRSACAYAQSDQSLCLSLEYSMTVKLLAEHHLELLSLKGGCAGPSESTLVKVPHCWKSHVAAHVCFISIILPISLGDIGSCSLLFVILSNPARTIINFFSCLFYFFWFDSFFNCVIS